MGCSGTSTAFAGSPGAGIIRSFGLLCCNMLQVKTKMCDQPWPQRVPQRDFSFSDHEAVRAVLTVTPVKGKRKRW